MITAQPTNLAVNAGDTATFSVTAISTPPLTYQWSCNGTNLTDGGNISGSATSTLTLTDVLPGQAGNYSVLVTNAYGMTNSATATLTVNLPPPCDPPPAGLVSWWRAEGNAADSFGTNNGAVAGGVSYAAGEVGQAFDLDGSSGYVLVPASASLNVGLSGGLTIEGWINPNDLSVQRPMAEWNNGNPYGWGTQFWISGGNAGGLTPGSLYASVTDTSGQDHIFYSAPGILVTNQFQHVALTYDKGSGVGTIYLNGMMVAQQNLGMFTPQTSYNLYLGHRPGYSQYWSGELDEISVYNRALSSNEIAGIYNAGINGKCVPGDDTVVVWGDNSYGQTNLPDGLANVVGIASGYGFNTVLLGDGTVMAWGQDPLGETNVPAGLTHVTAIASGYDHTLALLGNGTVVAWGSDQYGQSSVPDGLTNVAAIAAGAYDSVALESDGTVVEWGDDYDGATDVPAGLTNVTAVAAGYHHTVALLNNGTVVAWGESDYGETAVPAGLTNVTAIAASAHFTLALKSDGTVTAWGASFNGAETNVPAGLSGVTAIAAGGDTAVALTSNGTVVAWGDNSYANGLTNVPAGLANVTAVAAGPLDVMALVGVNSFPAITQQPQGVAVAAGGTASFTVTATGAAPLSYQWSFDGTNLADGGSISGSATSTLTLTGVELSQAGNYSVQVANSYGSVTSSPPATLIVTTLTTNLLVNGNFGTAAVQTGPAVLGSPGDVWNALAAASGPLVNSAGNAVGGLGFTWNNPGQVYTSAGGTAMDPATTPLMEDYAFGYNTSGYTPTVQFSITGLNAYTNAAFTLVVFAAGNQSGQGATLALTGATGGNTAGTLTTSATSRQISAGAGIAYQTFTGTLTGGTLTVVATENSGQPFAVVNGFQLQLVTSAPFITITAPVPGQLWSNNTFTVTGTAGDDVAVTNVLYSVNGSAWTSATTANNWANWTAPVNLTAGTNTIQACAVNALGTFSATNTVSFIAVLSTTLTVNTNGYGTVNPDYNGALLQIGNDYAMTATAGSGFAFTGWTGSLTNNNPTLMFTMASNLTFTANFVDVQPPTNAITAPLPEQLWSNNTFTVTGTAGDNVAVSMVLYSVNGSAWASATTANNWATWTAAANLIAGTNTIQAYAVDTSGNLSATNRVSFLAVLSTTLTVITNGGGGITPADNGLTLQIGAGYMMTAVADKHFVFTNWTDGLGHVLTNGPTLQFVMSSNLTLIANFLDTIKPTLSITNPARSGGKWSNDVFTVSGKCGDNVAVSNVLCSVNGGLWLPATLSNHGSNWMEQVSLKPGMNTLSAYAIGDGGNVSKTNTVTLDYILSARLTVEIVGSGTLTPDDNGELLAIGNSYTMKAVAGKGFAFSYWSGGVPMSINPTLTFTMASNLTVIAHFRDATPPVATITFPTPNLTWSSTNITVTGRAGDNVGVVGVGVQINNGGWLAAQTANGYTNWTATNLPVVFGPNLVQACAMDAAGNLSLTNEVKFLGILAPASLAGYEATLKPNVGKPELVLSWGDDTWAQTGTDSDTNADDYAAGTYTYLQTGPATALLTNVDIGMLSALGATNVTTVSLTFTSTTTASYAWTNGDDSGSGTATISPVTNRVPATLAGHTVQFYAGNGSKAGLETLNNDGTFTQSKGGVVNGSGTYLLIQYSPTVAILQQNFTDVNDAGAVSYAELTFTSATAGQTFYSYYLNPVYDSAPDDIHWGTFKIQ